MVTIMQLRKNNKLNSKLGFRERDILFSKGVKVKKATDYGAGFYEVYTASKYFVVNLGSKSQPLYAIVA